MQVLEEDTLHNRPFHNNPVVRGSWKPCFSSFLHLKIKIKIHIPEKCVNHKPIVYFSVKNIQHIKEIVNAVM